MDKTEARRLRHAVVGVLQTLGENEKLQVRITSGRWGPHQVVFKVELAEIGEDGKAETQERTDFTWYAPRRSRLEETDLDREFEYRGETWRIEGWKRGARTYPVICQNTRLPRRMRFAAGHIKDLLEAS